MRVGIIGAGNWGTTLALYLSEKKEQRTVLYEYYKEKAELLKKNRINSDYLPGYKIPENIKITSNPEELANNSDAVFLVQPSHTIPEIISLFKELLKNKIIASFTKGINPESLQRVSQIIEEIIPEQKNKVIAVSGPSIAREVVRGVPTSLVSASRDVNRAEKIQKELSSETIRVYTSSDITGVELGGSLKNVYALASGICDGLTLGVNAKAALLTRSMAELTRLGVKMGGKMETFSGLSGFGDLIVTSFSEHSRNRTTGEKLGQGNSLDKILGEMKETVEGINTTRSVKKLSEKYNVDMPIATEVYKIIFENKNLEESIKSLMQRELKKESR